jgi:hypothetical protein
MKPSTSHVVAREWLLFGGCFVAVAAWYVYAALFGSGLRQDLSATDIVWRFSVVVVIVYAAIQSMRFTFWAVKTLWRTRKAN